MAASKPKRKASPAQIAARKRFAEMAKSGAFKKRARAGSKRAKATKAQLAARAKLAAAARARLKALRDGFSCPNAPPRRKKAKAGKKNPKYWRGRGASIEPHVSRDAPSSWRTGTRKKSWHGMGSKAKRRAAKKGISLGSLSTIGGWGKLKPLRLPNPKTKGKKNPVRFKSEKEFAAWKAKTGAPPRRKKATKKSGVGGTLKKLGRSITRGLGMAHNPSKRQKRQRRIVRAKRQQVLAFKTRGIRRPAQRRGPGRLPNPRKRRDTTRMFQSGIFKGEPHKGKVRKVKRAVSMGFYGKRGKKKARKTAQRGIIKTFFNPSPASVFSEFRGKSATTKTRVKAAKGTPATLAKLGSLQELHVRGKKLRFSGGASLAADGRKRLHIVGVTMKRPNPPGEVDYGEILSVTYRADKPHIESGTYDYLHHFGEDGGKRPHLIVDEEGYPVIEGGSYKISSDGIID